jgi:hypothetical protein
LDLSKPVAILLIAVLHFIPDDGQATAVVRELLAALPRGSYLVATNVTKDFLGHADASRYDAMLTHGQVDAWPRTKEQFARFFDGLELLEPGIAPISEWRPNTVDHPRPDEVAMYGAVGRL